VSTLYVIHKDGTLLKLSTTEILCSEHQYCTVSISLVSEASSIVCLVFSWTVATRVDKYVILYSNSMVKEPCLVGTSGIGGR
jgi:hypothetical protein